MPATPAPPAPVHDVVWGSLHFLASKANILAPSNGDVRQYIRYTTLAGGLVRSVGRLPPSALGQYTYNSGLLGYFDGSLGLPFKLYTQTAISSGADISGFNTANKRVHGMAPSLGDSTGLPRYHAGVGKKLYCDNLLANWNLAVRDTFNDNITAVLPLSIWNSTAYVALGFDNNTDGLIRGATTVNGSGSLTLTTLVTGSASDRVDAMVYLPDVGPGIIAFIGTYGGTRGLWWVRSDAAVPATPRQVVSAATKALPGTGSTTYSGLTLPYLGSSHRTADPTAGIPTWSSTSSVIAEDGVVASVTPSSSTISEPLVAVVDFSDLPRDAEVTGIVVRIVWKETDAGMDTAATQFQLLVNGSAVGIDRAGELSEPGTTLASQDLGADGDTWGLAGLTTDDIRNLGIMFKIVKSTGTAGTVEVDDFQIGVYYREKGTAVTVPAAGGWTPGRNPADASQFAVIGPDKADASGTTEARRLHLYALEWDPTGARVVATHTTPNTGLRTVNDAAPYLGGWAVTGGTLVKHVGADGQRHNLPVPPFMGSESASIIAMWPLGDALFMDVYLSNLKRQFWVYRDGVTHVAGIAQTLVASSERLTSQPLYVAEKAPVVPYPNFGFLFSFIPDGASGTGCAHQVVADLGIDPRIVGRDLLLVRQAEYSGSTEQTTPAGLYLNPAVIDDGNLNWKRSLLGAQAQSPFVDDSSNYGSVWAYFDGDPALSSANFFSTGSNDYSHEFTSSFEEYNIPSSGLGYRTLKLTLALSHAIGTTKTPDGLPLLVKTAAHPPMLRRFEFEVDSQTLRDFMTLLNDIKTLQGTQITQQLKFGNYDLPAVLDRASLALTVPPYGAPPSKTDEQVGKNILAFTETEGTTA